MAHARHLARIEVLLRRLLPANLVPHCRVANLRRGELLLQVESPAWASKLRYLTPALRESLATALGEEIRLVTLRIAPVAESRPATHDRRAKLSTASGAQIEQAATSIDHPPLREALLRLARRKARNGG